MPMRICRSKLLGSGLVLGLLVVVASTATAVPNTFVNGTVADADPEPAPQRALAAHPL